jgi:nitrate/TMAO reductase-like tetraheme cytochrome c subunit
MTRAQLVLPIVAGLLLVALCHVGPPSSPALADTGSRAASRTPSSDPMGPNAACYVCHLTFVREELSQTHLRAKITCIKCHGLSAKHANDENIGATKPDVTFARADVNAACRKCHRKHDVPPEKVVARWLERRLTESPPVCTDCHGTHKIERAAESPGT